MLDDLLGKIKVDKRKAKDLNLSAQVIKDAYRATKLLPQAVLKVSSYSHGVSRANAHLSYISRNGDLAVEDPQGNTIQDVAEFNERMNEWALDFDQRKDSRDTVNIVLSAPKDSNVDAVRSSVRMFARHTFGQSNDYLFAIHNDTEHPHGHLMVKMRGYDGEKLNPGRKDLREWRASFAEVLREHGVEVDASSRLARGVGRKGKRQKILHIQNKVTPDVDKKAIKEVIKDIQQGNKQSDKPWAKAAKIKTHQEKDKLNFIADVAKQLSEHTDNLNMGIMAENIKRYAEKIPEPKTLGEEIERQFDVHKARELLDRDR